MNLEGYRNSNLPLTIQEGDELRTISQSNEQVIFTVTSYKEKITELPSPPALPNKYHVTGALYVDPNPQDYKLLTVSSSFTIIRKIDVDNKIRLNVDYISGSLGDLTPSSDGYLIPDDFTQENKDKVGKLIAILKGNNVFD